jgi:uncharacterized protein
VVVQREPDTTFRCLDISWFLTTQLALPRQGTAASGIGGPHVGLGHIWPMALTARGWTAVTDSEVSSMLETLVNSSACSGLMHESFSQDDFTDFTRPWFAWANSFFADFVLKVIDERPHLVLKPPGSD